MARFDPIAQARVLDRLLGIAAATPSDRGADAAAVLAHYQREAAVRPGRAADELRALATALARIHLECAEHAPIAYAHCHLAGVEDAGPLWLRTRIVGAMKQLAGRPAAVLLVTGVRASLCPAGRRWTRRRADDYARLSRMVDELAADWASPETALQVIVL